MLLTDDECIIAGNQFLLTHKNVEGEEERERERERENSNVTKIDNMEYSTNAKIRIVCENTNSECNTYISCVHAQFRNTSNRRI